MSQVDPARVSLGLVTEDNVRAVVKLAVAEGQRGFVAGNATSLAQALFAPSAWYRAICVDDEPVGFVMLADDSLRVPPPAEPAIGVWRLMIDERHQGRGIGAAALRQVIAHARGKGFVRLELSYVPGPGCPEPFYRSLGFVDTGRFDGDEVVLEIALEPLPPGDAWMQPLQAGALRLEPVTPAHAEAMFPLLADPELYRYIDQPPPVSLEALRARYGRLAKGAPPGNGQRWLNWIVRPGASGGEPLGTVQATVIDADRHSWIAYVFGRAHHGRGHARAAVTAMIGHLAERGVVRLLAMVDAGNAASIRLLERLGFGPASDAELQAHPPEGNDRLLARDLAHAIDGAVSPFATQSLPDAATVIAPDGSDVRVLPALAGGGLARFFLAAGRTAAAVTHRSVEEIWHVIEGRGEIWRRHGRHESVTPLAPGVSITIPLGTHFQFRAAADEPLEVVAVTMPPWPGADEAVAVEGPWVADAVPSGGGASGLE